MIKTPSGCEFKDEQAVIDRIYEKGIENEKLDNSYQIECSCGNTFEMDTFITKCECGATYGVTPCSQADYNNIVKIG